METCQITMDKMGQISKRFTTFFVVIFIAVPVFIVTLMYQNSSFSLFEGSLKAKVFGDKALNAANGLLCRRPNATTNGFPLGGTYNDTVSEVRGKIQNVTSTEERASTKNTVSSQVGSKNGSLTSSTNDSTLNTGIHDDKDKLLHGLLASGFDEASCISRMQSQLYRKASPRKPSPYLRSKLRNYEEIHRRCGPYSRAYKKSMRKILGSKNNGAAAKCKYVVWLPANGLGNQMISMAATFLYAVLTDRVLLVKFGKDKHGLFCEPFLNSTWILSEKSPFWKNEMHVQTYQSLLKQDMANISKMELPSALFLNLQHTLTDPEEFFHCDHSQDLLRKVPLLILQSDQYFVPSMFMTPFFNPELIKMFPERDKVFHHLGRYLFHPSNEEWGVISKFYEAHLAKADERIGIQIRVFSPASTPQQTIMNLVLTCTTMHKLLPEVGMPNSLSSTGKNQTVKAILVTSLYPEYGENLRAMYLSKQTITGEVIEVYQPSHEEHQKFNDNKHNMKAWTDMYLLSLSDKLVTTSVSTFGYVAQGLGNLRPWLLHKLVNNQSHVPNCERDISLEPCYHHPPKHYCNGKPLKDFASSFLHMRRCKDAWYGVKLVNGSA